MKVNALAGTVASAAVLADIPRLVTAYYAEVPDPAVAAQRVAFGTSGHRGSALERSFNEQHVLAITQAICSYRQAKAIDGPLFSVSIRMRFRRPLMSAALEVLAANNVDVMIAPDGEYTPTPAVSHAILAYNKGRAAGLADGIVVTPSHNHPKAAASNTTRRMADPLTRMSPIGLKRKRIVFCRAACVTSSGLCMKKRCAHPRPIATTTSPATSMT
jgi:phosphoglucomutase